MCGCVARGRNFGSIRAWRSVVFRLVLELGSRTRDQPAPPHVVWEALVDPFRVGARRWLDLADDEVTPRIFEAVKPTLVVWSSLWPDRADDQICFDLEPAGSGCSLRWTLSTFGDPPDAGRLGRLRYRPNFLINGELRYSFGQ